MAIYNEILNARFAKALTKIFGMKGSNPTRQLAGELMPTWNFPSGVEDRYLQGWVNYFLGSGVSAVAAQNSVLQLRNPTNSGVIAVITKATFGPSGLTAVAASWSPTQPTDLGTIISVIPPDTRTSSKSTCILSVGTLAGGQNLANIVFVAADAGNVFLDALPDAQHEIPLFPGSTFRLADATVNLSEQFSLFWRERPIDDSEAKA